MERLIFFLTAWQSVSAKPAVGPHSQVELVSEHVSIQPGKPYWVGLRFKSEPGWHIYWKNPGDSGTPPSIQWRLPPGFQAGPIQWPYPRHLETPPLANFGYQNEVLSPVSIQTPSALKLRWATLRAHVDWLVCQEECLPASGDVHLDLPASKFPPAVDARWSKAFQAARQALPMDALSWRFSANRQGQWLSLVLVPPASWRALQPRFEFFPEDDLVLENAAPQSVTRAQDGTIFLRLRISPLRPHPSRLRGVLVSSSGFDENGKRKAARIDVLVMENKFRKLGVALVRADWTSRDAAISEALSHLGRSGVPVYALYGPRSSTATLLPAILTKSLLLRELEKLPAPNGKQK